MQSTDSSALAFITPGKLHCRREDNRPVSLKVPPATAVALARLKVFAVK